MDNFTIQLKIKQRLNKLDSHDYDNIELWQIIEAFNKAQLVWCRRQIHGYNQFKEGDEGSKVRIDDLQVLLKDVYLKLTPKKKFEEMSIPSDYFQFKRVSADARVKDCSNSHNMVIYLAEESNVDELLRDVNRNPNFAWGETFCTLIDNKIRIYTDDKFVLEKAKLTYYRLPTYIEIAGVQNPYTKKTSSIDVNCDFKDDVVEVLIDEAVKILSGDIESQLVYTTTQSEIESNN